MSTPTRVPRRGHERLDRPPCECIALLLQGGGALGAYQGGVHQALSEAHLDPQWVAGISIGAVNAALIAGNAPEARGAKLREFWRRVTEGAAWDLSALLGATPYTVRGDFARGLVNRLSAGAALLGGVCSFFAPRAPVAWLQPPGFPAVEIEGEFYWDGGLVSNTPLQWVLESEPRRDTLAFQVDLWSARGAVPRTMAEVIRGRLEGLRVLAPQHGGPLAGGLSRHGAHAPSPRGPRTASQPRGRPDLRSLAERTGMSPLEQSI
jgi:NTE family protein